MVVENARTENDIHFADASQRRRLACIAEDEFYGRVARLFLFLEFWRRAENVDAFYRRRAGLFGNERIFSIDAPHTTDIYEAVSGRVLAYHGGEMIITANVMA